MNFILKTIGVYVLMGTLCLAHAKRKAYDGYDREVEVPEPLFVDLVRSLTADPGEFEINSLFYHRAGSFDDLKWAPELEYVLPGGVAVEFELPSVGGRLETYKLALQTRIFPSVEPSQQHGLQWIYEVSTDFKQEEVSLYYIYARRFRGPVSILGLYGLKRSNVTESLLNQSFFYNYTEEIDFGLEFNYASGEGGQKYWQLIPQLHLALQRGGKIQFGFGGKQESGAFQPIATFRLIVEFNE